MKRILTFTLAFALVALFFSSCSKDKKVPQLAEIWEMPSLSFGSSMSEIESAEAARGFNVTKDGNTLKLSKVVDGVSFDWVYYGDEKGNYLYSTCVLPQQYTSEIKDYFVNQLKFNQINTKNSDYTIFTDNKTYISLYNPSSAKSFPEKSYFLVAPFDNDIYSWTRFSDLEDECGLYLPLIAENCPKDLFMLYELRHGHTLNTDKTAEDRGVYFFDTHDETMPIVRYWLDVDTKSKLEECAIYYSKNSLPSVKSVKSALEKFGFIYTSMKDPNDGSVVYYDYSKKRVAYVKMAPWGDSDTWEPFIHFTFQNMDTEVPPLSVEFPYPITTFGSLTLEEAIKLYEKESYYDGIDDKIFGPTMPFIKTKIPEFPYILIMNDMDEKYYSAAMVIADNVLVARSPYILKLLAEKGFKETTKPSIPTFVNVKEDIGVQFDFNDMSGLGAPNISFQPNQWGDPDNE